MPVIHCSRRAVRATAAIVAAALGSAAAIAAAAEPSRAEQLIRYRQSLYFVTGANFGQLAAMVNGKTPYDAQDFATRADRVAYFARMLPEAFPAESQRGAPTKAKAEIWTERAEFDRLLRDLQARSSELARAAQTNDLGQIRPAFAATGRACKSCHDRFRAD